MRPMSGIDLAPRNASRKLSDVRFSERNSIALVIISVQEPIEASARPTITTFTSSVASMNIVPTLILPPCFICGGSPASGAVPPGAGAVALASAGAPAGAAAVELAAAGAAGGAFWANAGALTASAIAPMRAMKGVLSLLSSICRQFLVGLARLAGGSSRESVSTLVETCPSLRPSLAGKSARQNRCRCARPVTRTPNEVWKNGVSKAGDFALPGGDLEVLPLC